MRHAKYFTLPNARNLHRAIPTDGTADVPSVTPFSSGVLDVFIAAFLAALLYAFATLGVNIFCEDFEEDASPAVERPRVSSPMPAYKIAGAGDEHFEVRR